MIFVPTESFLMQEPTQSWYLYLLLFLFISYALVRSVLGRLSSSTLMATVRYSNAASMYNDNSQLQRKRDLVLNMFYFLSMGFFTMIVFQEREIYPYDLTDYKLFAFIVAVIFSIFILKNGILIVLGFIFNRTSLFREYLYQGYSYNKLMGIVFLPLNFILIYSSGTIKNIAIYLAISILFILIIFKTIRGLIFSFKNGVFNFYMFLYLCALEIVPLLLLYKWFSIIV